MESLRRPEMIISVAAMTGLLGSIIYFYKKSNALQAELEKLAEHLAGTARKVGELQTQGRDLAQLVEAIKQLNAFVTQHDVGLRELKESLEPLNEEIEDFHFVIDQMIEAFKDQGIDIEREPRRRRKTPRSGRSDRTDRSSGRSRRAAKPVSDSESESEEEEPVPSRRTTRKAEVKPVKPSKPAKPVKPAKPPKPAKPAKVDESEDEEDEESDSDVAAAAAIAASRRQK
jgi:seryl-tRNA synthetase